jgi:hypothetical protein
VLQKLTLQDVILSDVAGSTLVLPPGVLAVQGLDA